MRESDEWYGLVITPATLGVIAIVTLVPEVEWSIRLMAVYWLTVGFIVLSLAYFGIVRKPRPKPLIVPIEQLPYMFTGPMPIYGNKPGMVQGGIHRFDSQADVPPTKSLMDYAQSSVGILVWDGEKLIGQGHDSIRKACERGVKVTALLMAPDHDDAINGEKVFGEFNIPNRIETTLKTLCNVKQELGSKGHNLVIKTYHVKVPETIILIDDERGSNFAWAQATPWIRGMDSDSRISRSAFEKENATFYAERVQEYKRVLESSDPFKCEPQLRPPWTS